MNMGHLVKRFRSSLLKAMPSFRVLALALAATVAVPTFVTGSRTWLRQSIPSSSRVESHGMAVLAGVAAAVAVRMNPQGSRFRVTRKYTTKTIIPSLAWLKTGFSGGELACGELRGVGLAGCDVCIGRTESGKLFCIGDKAPPTGISLSVGGSVVGEKVIDPQYGNTFDAFTGQPEGDWCPSPPLIGSFVGWFMGEQQALAAFEVREAFFGGEVEVLIDTNAKQAYEANYWKGLLDAQGKDDGTYY